MIVQDAFAVIALGIVFFATLLLAVNLPPYITGLERAIYQIIPLVVLFLIIYIILY